METNVSYTVAGTFILILLLSTVYAVIWMSAGFNYKTYELYTVYMNESVSGLSIDGAVEFNGINVGSVSEMKINHQDPKLITLTVKVEKGTPISAGTRAKLSMKGFTGVAYVLLEDRGFDMKPLVKEPGQKYPVIITSPSLLVRLDTTLNQISSSFSKLSVTIESLLDKQNLQMIKDILHAGKGSLRSLETRTIPDANETVQSINDMTQHLDTVISEIGENPAVIIRGKAPSTKLGPGER